MKNLKKDEQGFGLISGLISFVFGVIGAIVGLRFIFRLFGANASNAIVNWIYAASEPLVRPFFGIFNTTIDVTVGTFELETLLALVVYSVIGGLLLRLFNGGRSDTIV